jgi:Family of unknown function (DUF6459)
VSASALQTLRPPVSLASVQGSLALEVLPRVAPPLTTVPEPTIPPIAELDVVPVATATRRELERWARRYGQAVAEVATGDRPASQVLRWSTSRVYDDLVRRALLVAQAGRRTPTVGRERRVTSRPQLRGVRISFVAGHIVEASFHVKYGERSRAIAARFEVLDDRWQCSALEFA